jgi:S1-C subfamily serine protease
VRFIIALLAVLAACSGCGAPALKVLPVTPESDTADYFRWLSDGTVQVQADCPDGSGSGSGVVVGRYKDKTYVATAAHVANFECVVTIDGEIFEVAAVDEQYDQSIVVGYAKGRAALVSPDPFLGQSITIVGYPSQPYTGKTSKQITKGNLSAFVPFRYKVTAPAYFGNSGGPCFDAQGRLVGLVVALIQRGGTPMPGEIFVTPAQRTYELLEEALE